MHNKRQPKILDIFQLPKAKLVLEKGVHFFFNCHYNLIYFIHQTTPSRIPFRDIKFGCPYHG